MLGLGTINDCQSDVFQSVSDTVSTSCVCVSEEVGSRERDLTRRIKCFCFHFLGVVDSVNLDVLLNNFTAFARSYKCELGRALTFQAGFRWAFV